MAQAFLDQCGFALGQGSMEDYSDSDTEESSDEEDVKLNICLEMLSDLRHDVKKLQKSVDVLISKKKSSMKQSPRS